MSKTQVLKTQLAFRNSNRPNTVRYRLQTVFSHSTYLEIRFIRIKLFSLDLDQSMNERFCDGERTNRCTMPLRRHDFNRFTVTRLGG